jgi:gamma-glutamyl-gamma-aminobutyraldehyde dehydrogenase
VDRKSIEALRRRVIEPQGFFVSGQRKAGRGAPADVVSPIDGSRMTTLAQATPAEVDQAVAAARAAFEKGDWRKADPAARKRVLVGIAERIEAEALELAVLGVRDNGTEISMALKAEPGSAAATFRYYAEAIDKIYGEIAPTPEGVLGLIHRAPVGVVAAIVPWNFPLMIGAWKLAPALAAGNSVVLKPSEAASLTLLRLAEIATEAGLPPGVLNVVTGRGSIVGDALARHMDVDVLAFTGSGGVGRQLLKASADSNLKRVYMELGGKSPNIVFADTPDLDAAVLASVNGMFRNAGQICIAGTRLLVERSIHDAFVERLVAQTGKLRVGDPLDPDTHVGAVATRDQLASNLRFVDKAVEEGANLVAGGKQILEETGGFYMEPTIFTDVAPEATLAREEVFGPVLAVTPFEDEADSVRLANATPYGLSGAVWTRDLSRAHRMIRAVRTGLLHVNGYGGSDLTVPLGGVKQSGNGHDKSLHALDKFLDLKSAWIKL